MDRLASDPQREGGGPCRVQPRRVRDPRTPGPGYFTAGPILLATHLDRVLGDFVVLCRSVLSETPESFLLTPEEARAAAVPVEKDGTTSFWLPPRAYDRPEFREAWLRLGTGVSPRGLPNPACSGLAQLRRARR